MGKCILPYLVGGTLGKFCIINGITRDNTSATTISFLPGFKCSKIYAIENSGYLNKGVTLFAWSADGTINNVEYLNNQFTAYKGNAIVTETNGTYTLKNGSGTGFFSYEATYTVIAFEK